MNKTPIKFRFPEDIQLEKNSLIEAWLEIRWQLEPSEQPEMKKDIGFDIAIGVFSGSVKKQYPLRIALDASRVPQDLLPHVVRYQFRESKGSWPALQIGPGVATVNFTTPYTWGEFKQAALFLRSQLVNAYETELKTEAIFLRYRNAIPFNYTSNNLLEFMSHSLNISITRPSSIPGEVGDTDNPVAVSMGLSFKLKKPKGIGSLKFLTGTKKTKDEATEQENQIEAIIFDVEVGSETDGVPSLSSDTEFDEWLTDAHRIIHDWYFSLIDGPLHEEYQGKKD